MTPRKFWMVWVSGKSSPTKRHPALDAANCEAERLACLPDNKGRNVYVLEAHAYCHTPAPVPVHWIEL